MSRFTLMEKKVYQLQGKEQSNTLFFKQLSLSSGWCLFCMWGISGVYSHDLHIVNDVTVFA